jgi:hypothetical protein
MPVAEFGQQTWTDGIDAYVSRLAIGTPGSACKKDSGEHPFVRALRKTKDRPMHALIRISAFAATVIAVGVHSSA